MKLPAAAPGRRARGARPAGADARRRGAAGGPATRRGTAGPMPTVLVRTPYGRRGAYGLLYGLVYAQRGLQVLVQSVRGTFGSGGEFAPFDERDDGLDTVALDRGAALARGRARHGRRELPRARAVGGRGRGGRPARRDRPDRDGVAVPRRDLRRRPRARVAGLVAHDGRRCRRSRWPGCTCSAASPSCAAPTTTSRSASSTLEVLGESSPYFRRGAGAHGARTTPTGRRATTWATSATSRRRCS